MTCFVSCSHGLMVLVLVACEICRQSALWTICAVGEVGKCCLHCSLKVFLAVGNNSHNTRDLFHGTAEEKQVMKIKEMGKKRREIERRKMIVQW